MQVLIFRVLPRINKSNLPALFDGPTKGTTDQPTNQSTEGHTASKGISNDIDLKEMNSSFARPRVFPYNVCMSRQLVIFMDID